MTTLIPHEVSHVGSRKINTLSAKEIFLCADDYAQNNTISEGILQLVKSKRISAMSCLVNSGVWKEASEACLPLYSSSFIGLHLNFTLGPALSVAWQNHYGKIFGSLPRLIKACYLGQLKTEIVHAEIQAQIDNFCNKMGFLPDFIDGHHHVHQLPVIRDILLSMHQKQALSAFFRSTSRGSGVHEFLPGKGFPKKQLIALLGGFTFKKQLLKLKIPTNTSFSGMYLFNDAKNYRKYFRQFLNHSRHKGLIMCHPGTDSKDMTDPQREARPYELNYFSSDDFLQDLKENQAYLIFKN